MKNYIIVIVIIVLLGIVFFVSKKSKTEVSTEINTEINTNQNTEKEVPVSTEENVNIKDEVKDINNIENKKIMIAILNTNKGDITIEFLENQAPNTVANFEKLAKDKFYDGIKFHRVIKGFMIQGGDPLTKDDSNMALWGTGGPGYKFADEISATNKNDVGTIAMANAGPNTNGSQFFINTASNNFLDGKHTVFGKITSGMDVVTKIENTPTAPGDRPLEAVIINSITLK